MACGDSAYPARVSGERKPSIDALRGLVMVLMALDHARDYFGPTPFWPSDVELTTPTWFGVRWVTHFCAPVFVFLAGTAAWYKGRKVGTRALSRWLVLRGLWLILVEIFLNSPIWFATAWGTIGVLLQVQVLWAIGISMICLGGLCRLPRGWAAAVAVLLIAGHNLLDGIGVPPVGSRSALDILWALLHVPINLPIPGVGMFAIGYPALPWIGVLAAGWWFGEWFETRARRARSLLVAGFGLTAAFVLLRWANVYGDLYPYETSERGPIFTFLSFLDCTKYPPSLCYLLMTLGPALMVLALFERVPAAWLRHLLVFGRVPMFFYLLHVALLNAGASLLTLHSGRPLGWWWMATGNPYPGFEPSLAVVLAAWVAVVLALYGPCRFWGRLKASRRSIWLDLF